MNSPTSLFTKRQAPSSGACEESSFKRLCLRMLTPFKEGQQMISAEIKSSQVFSSTNQQLEEPSLQAGPKPFLQSLCREDIVIDSNEEDKEATAKPKDTFFSKKRGNLKIGDSVSPFNAKTTKTCQHLASAQLVTFCCKCRSKCTKLRCACLKNKRRCLKKCVCNKDNKAKVATQKQIRELTKKELYPPVSSTEPKQQTGSQCCRCRRSRCKAQYCQCRRSGAGCGPNCGCKKCLNKRTRNPCDSNSKSIAPSIGHGEESKKSSAVSLGKQEKKPANSPIRIFCTPNQPQHVAFDLAPTGKKIGAYPATVATTTNPQDICPVMESRRPEDVFLSAPSLTTLNQPDNICERASVMADELANTVDQKFDQSTLKKGLASHAINAGLHTIKDVYTFLTDVMGYYLPTPCDPMFLAKIWGGLKLGLDRNTVRPFQGQKLTMMLCDHGEAPEIAQYLPDPGTKFDSNFFCTVLNTVTKPPIAPATDFDIASRFSSATANRAIQKKLNARQGGEIIMGYESELLQEAKHSTRHDGAVVTTNEKSIVTTKCLKPNS